MGNMLAGKRPVFANMRYVHDCHYALDWSKRNIYTNPFESILRDSWPPMKTGMLPVQTLNLLGR